MKGNAANEIKLNEGITRREINALLKNQGLVSEGQSNLPQANNFNRIVRILEYIGGQTTTKKEIEMHQGFSYRQAAYYLDAMEYLWLLNKNDDGTYSSTSIAERINALPPKQKCLELANLILQHPVFRRFFKECAYSEAILKKETAVRFIKDGGCFVDDNATLERRAATVRCWVIWIYSLAWDVQIDCE